MRHPVEEPLEISEGFGPRAVHPVTGRPAFHYGVDYGKTGPILAMAAGTMLESVFYTASGWNISVDYGAELLGVSMHCAAPSPLPAGTPVRAGQVIGTIGNTGTSTTGRHLHQELRRRGVPVNPLDYITTTPPAAGIAGLLEGLAPMTVIRHRDGKDRAYYAVTPFTWPRLIDENEARELIKLDQYSNTPSLDAVPEFEKEQLDAVRADILANQTALHDALFPVP